MFKTGSTATERMRIDSSGNVGIGTSSPEAAIHIIAPANQEPMTIEASTNSYNYITHRNAAGTDVAYTGLGGGAALVSGSVNDYAIRANANLLFGAGSSTERMRIDSSGKVGIGTTSPTGNANGSALVLEVHSSGANPPEILAGGQNAEISIAGGVAASYLWSTGAYPLVMATNATERMRIDSSGNIGINTSSPSALLDLVGPSSTPLVLELNSANSNCDITMQSASTSSLTRLRNGTNDFQVHTNGTERMRINSSGSLLVGKTADNFALTGSRISSGGVMTLTADANELANFNRLTNDGVLVYFTQANVTEGNISVSGSTVSYNGGHLARWSQLSDGLKDTSLLKGTVLTNLDQMAVWSHDAVAATYYEEGDVLPEGVLVGDEKTPAVDAYTEDNEQLNCMAVSSVEGDPNVAGVFVNWDHEDDQFNDMNIAMTGDMIIRIAQGTTVQRGDLLMSAGDGTAKPQGDDIVRSKTIAKVTSTHVTCTYEDGSYCVPCVLMAC